MSLHLSLRRRREYKPRFDRLEDRTVPAASVVVTGTTLTITGDATSQQILVLDNGGNGNTLATPSSGFNQPSFSRVPTKITVIADGVSQTFTQDIRTVIINSGTSKSKHKSDTIVYFFTNGLQAGGVRTITSTLGGRRGNFNLVLGASPAPVPGSSGNMFLQGGIANDASLAVNVTGTNRSRNPDGTFAAKYVERIDAVDAFFIGARSSFTGNLAGGVGNDSIGVEVLASSIAPNSSLIMNANGVRGNDRIAEDITVSGETSILTGPSTGTVGGGTVIVTEQGGRGDALFGLLTNFSNAQTNFEATQPQPPGFTNTFQPLKVNATARGGHGRNLGLFTPNVLFTGIRDVTIV